MTSELCRLMPVPGKMLDVLSNNFPPAHVKIGIVFGLYAAAITYGAYHFCRAYPLVRQTCPAFQEQTLYTLAQRHYQRNELDQALATAQQLSRPNRLRIAKEWSGKGSAQFVALATAWVRGCPDRPSPVEWKTLLDFIKCGNAGLRDAACLQAEILINTFISIKDKVHHFGELMACYKECQISRPVNIDLSHEALVSLPFAYFSSAKIYYSAGEKQLANTALALGEKYFNLADCLGKAEHVGLYVAAKLAACQGIPEDETHPPLNKLCKDLEEQVKKQQASSLSKLNAYLGIIEASKQLENTVRTDRVSSTARALLLDLMPKLKDPDTSDHEKQEICCIIRDVPFSFDTQAVNFMQPWIKEIVTSQASREDKIKSLRLIYACCHKQLVLRHWALLAVAALHNNIYHTMEAGDIKDRLGIELQGLFRDVIPNSPSARQLFSELFDTMSRKDITIEDFTKYFDIEKLTPQQKDLWLEDGEKLLSRMDPLYHRQAAALLTTLTADADESARLLREYGHPERRHLKHVYASIVALGAMYFYIRKQGVNFVGKAQRIL